jgi:hypothetical protein
MNTLGQSNDAGQPTLDEWRALYAAAGKVKELAPWQWMFEDDLFGVQNPETGQVGYVSVMGSLGEHLAIGVYLGSEGLDGFYEMHESDGDYVPELLLQIPQLQASFEDREALTREDKDVIKQLGLKFRGRQSWIQFRHYLPGYFPWLITRVEARFLKHVLEQVLDVTPRYKTNPELLDPFNDERYLVRVPKQEGNELVWSDEYLRPAPIIEHQIKSPLDEVSITATRALPRNRQRVEVDFFMMMTPTREKGKPPVLPYAFLMVDARNGMINLVDLLQIETTMDDLRGSIPMRLVDDFLEKGSVPAEINVGEEWLYQLLQPLAQQVGFKLRLTDELPALDAARLFLEGFRGLG